MQQAQRRPGGAEQVERLARFERLQDQISDEAAVDVLVFLDDVAEHLAENGHGARLGVKTNRLIHHGVEAAQVVNPEDVVGVGVGYQHPVQPVDVVADHLNAHVRCRVDQQLAARL